jgi:divalent metal cation (Fe/Co/Zn/Cd) transporter
MHPTSKKVILTALFANIVVAAFELLTAVFIGSSTILAEGYHSFSDTLNHDPKL